jgi:hypothetical protein
MRSDNNFNNIPYAQWLEQTLQDIIKLPVKGICLNAVLENGETYTAYHNVSMHDKITIAGFIQQDAMIDTLAVNGFIKTEEDEDGTEEE